MYTWFQKRADFDQRSLGNAETKLDVEVGKFWKT